MCGINGIFTKNKVGNLSKRISKMNDSIEHRGPDANGIFIEDDHNIALGHTRLSIIDISSNADQPMYTNDKRYVIVFNGEIYNFNDIKQELLEHYIFMTHSDTEVIIAAIITYGIDWFLNRANGMFAFCFYDRTLKQLILARDRFGVKPLYYTIEDNVLVFSSEIKGILSSGMYEAKLNHDAIDDYLGCRYVREPNTFFKNIFQFPVASYLTIDSRLNLNFIKYWSLPNKFNTDISYDEPQLVDEFKKELERSVSIRLISDVEVGTYLSGGLDSSLITAMVANQHDNLYTYSTGFFELNEFEYSDLVSKIYRTAHKKLELSKNLYLDLDYWSKLIKFRDSPLGVPNEIPLAKLSTVLKTDITVVLSGEGADELMGGYGRIFRADYEYSTTDQSKDFYRFFLDKYEYVKRDFRDKYLRINSNYRFIFDNKNYELLSSISNNEFIFRFFHTYHIQGLLQRLDSTTMCAGVEGRVPFLDYKLVEFSYNNIPFDLKLRWNNGVPTEILNASQISEIHDTPKYLLKRVAESYLPRDIVYRKKVGFPVPLNDWYMELVNLASNLLRNTSWLNILDFEAFIIDISKQNNKAQVLWMLINVEIFINLYFNKTYKW